MIERAIIIPDFMILLKEVSRGPACAADVQASINMTYAYIHYMKRHFADKGWVNIHKEGVAHNMHITEKGLEVVKVIDDLIEVLGIDYNDIMEYRRRRKESKRKSQNKVETPTMVVPELKPEPVVEPEPEVIQTFPGVHMVEDDEYVEEDFKEEISDDELAEFEADAILTEELAKPKPKPIETIDLNTKLPLGEPETASDDDLKEMEDELDNEEDWELEGEVDEDDNY